MSLQGEVVNVVDSDSYTMTNITRDATGEYKCSLAEKPSLEASINLTVSCELLRHTTAHCWGSMM